jgi:hypothetical protein
MKFLRQNDQTRFKIFGLANFWIYCAASKCDAEFSQRPDCRKIKREGEHAAHCKRWPKSDSVPQHCWHHKKHRKRWKDVPERRLRVRCDALGVAGIMPQPQNAEDRNQRQRNDQAPSVGERCATSETTAMMRPDKAALAAR